MKKAITAISIIAISLMLLLILNLFAQKKAGVVKTNSYYLTTTTNEHGRFDVNHGLSLGGHTDKTIIAGVIVSIKNKTNNSWYTVYAEQNIPARIAWSDTGVSGVFNDKRYFTNQEVRILIFTITLIG